MLDAYFRETPQAAVGIVLALVLATALAAVAVRTSYAAGLRVWLYVAALGSFVAVTIVPGAFDATWRWRSPFDVVVRAPDWDAFVSPVTDTTLNVWIGVPLGLAAILLALDVRSWWPVVVVVLTPWAAEWWQAVAPTRRHGLSGDDLAQNLYGIVVGMVLGVLVHLALGRAERRWGTDGG